MLGAVDIQVLIKVAHVHVIPILSSDASRGRHRGTPPIRDCVDGRHRGFAATLEVEHEPADHQAGRNIREWPIERFENPLREL